MNSMYSFWWDISMDWNLLTITYTQAQSDENKPQKVQSSSPILHLRRQFYFSQPFWYFAAIVFDFLLRITWSLKLSSHIYIRKLDSSIFLMEFMEIARRWVWVIFRLESEWVKRVYNTLPLQATPLENLRMGLLDRKGGAGMLSPIEEESN